MSPPDITRERKLRVERWRVMLGLSALNPLFLFWIAPALLEGDANAGNLQTAYVHFLMIVSTVLLVWTPAVAFKWWKEEAAWRAHRGDGPEPDRGAATAGARRVGPFPLRSVPGGADPYGATELYLACCRELGVAPGSDWAAIKGRWRRMVKHWHPDRGGEEGDWLRKERAYRFLEAFHQF